MYFNGFDLKPFLLVTAVRGRGVMQQQIETVAIPNRDGSLFRKKKVPSRRLEVDCIIYGDTEYDLRETINELNGILAVEKEVPIVFDDEPHFTYYGIPADSTDGEEIVETAEATLVFYCPDPCKYGPLKTTTSNIIDLASTAPTFPTLILTLNSPAQSVQIKTGINTLTLHYNFTAGDILRIESDKRKVFINNELRIETIDLTECKFPVLRKGRNEIIVSAAASLEVKYRERWY